MGKLFYYKEGISAGSSSRAGITTTLKLADKI